MHEHLTQTFSRFLRRRRVLGHFGRRPLLDALARPAAGEPLAHALPELLLLTAQEEPAAAVGRLDSHEGGLSAAEAASRLARDGPNEIDHEKPLPWWLHLWRCYFNPFNLLLSALAALSYLGADPEATIVIGTMVALSTLVRFVQEGRSHRAADSLRALVSNTATVLRRVEGATTPSPRLEISQHELVAGDWVALSAGDMIPADCRLLTARDLFVAQSAMTGESLPGEKFVQAAAKVDNAQVLDQRNLVFMGTSVVSGAATALVVATGSRTYFGLLASRVTASDAGTNAFQAGVNSVSWLLIRFALVMVPIVFVVNGMVQGNWLEAFLFALSVAVGLTPEMLPMIVTSTLAKGAVLLARKKVVVKRLDAIQNFGAMDVLCTDKTGTLTQDKIAVARHANAFGGPSDEVLKFAFLNSAYQTGLKNLLDAAVVDHVAAPLQQQLRGSYDKVDELPFDFVRRRMSVVVREHDGTPQLICKGALEEVLAACTQLRVAAADPPGTSFRDAPLDDVARERVHAVARGLAADGLRVIAVAAKPLAPGAAAATVSDEAGLVLFGFVAFFDPPKDSAAPALKRLADHGIAVKVLTGDNELVTAHVCDAVGLAADRILLGAEIDAMDDAALRAAAEAHGLFAKLTPLHKERIVRALRAQGHVVGFIGDGINDAPALRAADIGISVDSAVDIAKEAADIILLEKSLGVLDDGVVEGRTTFCNMLKYIRMTASSNFGNVFSVLVASVFLPFLPMLPLQLLTQNLLYDISQTGIPFDNVDPELVTRPLRWNPADIGRFMRYFGPLSSIFDIVTFAVMWWVFDAKVVARQGLFQSGWFVVGLLTQTLIVHLIRTPKLPFIQSRAAWPLMAMTFAVMALGLWLPMGPLAGAFKLQALPAAYFGWLAAILFSYCALTTLMKRWYIHRFGWQ